MTAQFIEKPSHMDVVIEALASLKPYSRHGIRIKGIGRLCLLQVTDGEPLLNRCHHNT